jgi:hypothetical protein
MALRITEFFGRVPLHPLAVADAATRSCPFVGQRCIKPNHGACSLAQLNGPAVIACPNRLYAENHKILAEIADRIFGFTSVLVKPVDVKTMHAAGTLIGREVAVFGRYWGQELPLQRPKGGDRTGTYYVDWVLARIGTDGKLAEFTAVEVQTIDTTGNYGEQAASYFAQTPFTDGRGRTPGFSDAGFNWENVNKRILPQLIYKGHVLRREARCTKGLFFVCPIEVLQKVKARLGNAMQDYVIANSTITFRGYQLGAIPDAQGFRPLEFVEEFTTAVDEVARALTFPSNLPSMNVYENAINQALSK